jgi:hypothetical protein
MLSGSFSVPWLDNLLKFMISNLLHYNLKKSKTNQLILVTCAAIKSMAGPNSNIIPKDYLPL